MNSNASTTNPQKDVVKFNYNSVLGENQRNRKLEETKRQMDIVNDIMTTRETTRYTNGDGNPILNSSQERIWFSRYVAFVFAIGRIFDDDDNVRLKGVLDYFVDNGENAYLDNHYRVDSYKESALVKEVEKKLRVGNGNYHVFMVPIVYADDEALKLAPEDQFARKGIVDKYTSWDSITSYMKEMIVKYGLLTNMKRTRTQTSTELGSTGLPEKQLFSNYDAHTKFDYKSENGNIQVMQEIDSNLKVNEELNNDYNKRARRTTVDRQGEYSGSINGMKRKGIYAQMREDLMTDSSQSSSMVGVETRLNERVPPKKFNEYQLFVNNETYDESNNKNIMHDASENRTEMPRFMQFATRRTTNGGRQVSGNSFGGVTGMKSDQYQKP